MNKTTKDRVSDRRPVADEDVSPAGTHDKPKLTDKNKTPGTGMLPDKESDGVEGPTG